MEKATHNLRTRCNSHCLLMGLDGVTYHALLGELSQSGALVEIDGSISHGLHVGEMCGLMLSEIPKTGSIKHTGKIVRLDSGSVGISFHHQEHIHQKKKFLTPT
jgi:hypothetical protein